MYLKDKIPSDSIFYLKESLKKANDEQRQRLFLVKMKNPLFGLLFAFILPGLDRIYKGDIVLGIVKAIFLFFSYVGLSIGSGIHYNETAAIVFLVFVMVSLIWAVADYFLVWKGICKDNLKRILEALQ